MDHKQLEIQTRRQACLALNRKTIVTNDNSSLPSSVRFVRRVPDAVFPNHPKPLQNQTATKVMLIPTANHNQTSPIIEPIHNWGEWIEGKPCGSDQDKLSCLIRGFKSDGSHIGDGGFSEVKRHSVNSDCVAVKWLHAKFIGNSDIRQMHISNEVNGLKIQNLGPGIKKSPNIVEVYALFLRRVDGDGVCYTVINSLDQIDQEQYSNITILGVIMEHLVGTELFYCIQKHHSKFTAKMIAHIAYCACNAVCYMKQHGYICRDIKVENFVLTINDEGRHNLKLVDFGAIKYIGERGRTRSFIGSLSSMAPEIAEHNQDYDFGADVWSLSVLIYQLLSATRPYESPTQNAGLRRITREDGQLVGKNVQESSEVFREDFCRMSPEEKRRRLINNAEKSIKAITKKPGMKDMVELALTGLKRNPRMRPPVEFMLHNAHEIVELYR